MKNKLSTKAIVIISIISIILSALTAISFNVYNYSKEEVEYTIEFTQNTKIKKIEINANDYQLVKLKDSELKLDKEDVLSAIVPGKTITIVAPITDNFYVSYLEDEKQTSDDMIIYKDGQLQEVKDNEYTFSIDKFNIIKNSINGYIIPIFIVMLFVMFGLVYYLFIYYDKVKNNEIKLYNIVLAMIDMFIIFICTYYILFLILRSLVVIPIICVFLYNLYVIKKVKDKKIENIYAMFSVIASIAMLFMMAPFNVPDEASHFLRAYKDSLFVGQTDDGGFWKFPSDVYELTNRFGRNLHSEENKLYAENYISEIFKNPDYEVLASSATNYGNVKNQSFLPYLPSAIVIFIGRMVNAPIFILFLLCRLINVIIVVCMCYVAIKLIPRFKKTLLIVSLFPVFIQQAAAINMDYMTNATIIMLISYIVFLMYKVEKINFKHLAIMALLCGILTLGKFGYFPILALMFLIPNNKFKNIKIAMTSKILFITIAFVISFALNMSVATNENIDVPQIDNVYGFKYVFKNPLRMIKIIISTMINRLDLDSFRGFIDGFGYSTVWNRGVFALLQIIMFFLYIMIKDDDDDTLNLNSRAVYLLIYFSIIGIIYVIAFLLFTKSGEKNIFGIQARYFIAPSLLLYIGVSNNKLLLKISNKKNFYSIITAISYVTAFISISFFYI